VSATGAGPAPGPGRPRPWAELRAELERVRFRPSKTLGQNFLLDPNTARSIAADAGLERGAAVLEVGAGCGALTRALAALGLRVLAVEIDARLLAIARAELGEADVRWLAGDALAGKHALAPELRAALPRGPWHLVANLPYSISGPLLVLLSRLESPPASMTVLVQSEVARRIASRPGESDWGALSARLTLVYRATLGRAVGPQVFWPRPRVTSHVVRLLAAPLDGLEAADVGPYDALVEHLFRQRRKQLRSVLAGDSGGREAVGRWLEGIGLDPSARGETLAAEALLRLSRSGPWRARCRDAGGGGARGGR
jgi:16S rRNA (adenine1518-N6/adenine1519-N6)-dimethyltransferase